MDTRHGLHKNKYFAHEHVCLANTSSERGVGHRCLRLGAGPELGEPRRPGLELQLPARAAASPGRAATPTGPAQRAVLVAGRRAGTRGAGGMETRAADGSFLGDLGMCGLPGVRGRLRGPRAASADIRPERGQTRSEGFVRGVWLGPGRRAVSLKEQVRGSHAAQTRFLRPAPGPLPAGSSL